jgi:hypothetical protein
MNPKLAFLMVMLLLALVISSSGTAAQAPVPGSPDAPDAPLSSAFTYQGRLTSTNGPVNGACDFQFILYDALNGGSQVGPILDRPGVLVTDSYFTVNDLDFGADAFAGEARYLEIAVRCPAGSGDYTTLSPRQGLTAAPYALYSPAAGNADLLDGQPASAFALASQTWSLTGNAGTNPAVNFLGTTDNTALELRVNGQRVLRLEPVGTSPNLIGGHAGNWITAGVFGANIAGGGFEGSANRVTDDFGVVSGGTNNQAGDNQENGINGSYATVGGGQSNTASGYTATVGGGLVNTASEALATVSGGQFNIASGLRATVGGGNTNTASGDATTVCGGYYNLASGFDATVAGGANNTASGNYAAIAGGLGNWADADFATIGGGGRSNPGDPESYNVVTDNYGTIGGGADNLAGNKDPDTTNAQYATVGGGYRNIASEGYATVGGGQSNTASGYTATVSGGLINTASENGATVSGGSNNNASGLGATISGGGNNNAGDAATMPGGVSNTASGDYSFAAGNQAIASQMGSFVWADTQLIGYDPHSYSSPGGGDNSFNIRATGGVYLVTAVDANGHPTAGMYLSAGGSGWNAYSSREFKTNFQAINPSDVLSRLAALPILAWNYQSQDASVRHIGPMAEDFNTDFWNRRAG